MNSQFKESRLYFWTVQILLIIIGVFLLSRMPFILLPIKKVFSAIVGPVLIAVFLFYVLKPLIRFFEKKGIHRLISFSLSLLLLICLISLSVISLLPQLVAQFVALSQMIPEYSSQFSQWLNQVDLPSSLGGFNVQEQLNQMNLTISNLLNFTIISLTNSLSVFASFLMTFLISLFTVPFILFFMFKDGDHFLKALSVFFPKKIKSELEIVCREIDEVLSAYITSTILDALLIGILSFALFTILGQPYALLLGVFCGVTNIIPYLGPFIGAVPALLIACFISGWQVLWTAVGLFIIQQLDANLIKPFLMAKSLSIHPLTIILILIGAGSIGGIIGMIICIPLYGIVKVIVLNSRRLYLAAIK